MTFRFKALGIVFAGLATVLAAQATTITFDSVTTSPTQAAGSWYTDRYAPAGFQVENFNGDNRLKHSISAADSAASRPGSFVAPFYNTQGRKYDLPAATTAMSIDLYLDDAWNDPTRRYAGFWGTAFDATDAVSHYPILEYGLGQFRFYDGNTGIFQNGFTPTQFDRWYTLSIELVAGNWIYEIDGTQIGSIADLTGSTRLANVILQGHNSTAGVNYDIYWDNLRIGNVQDVPEPASLALVGVALAAMAASRRRRTAAV